MATPLPDVVGAMIQHARLQPGTFTLSQGHIAGGRPRTRNVDDPTGWLMPTYGIVFIPVPGPTFPRPGRVPFRSQNIQVDCYGPDLRTAGNMYQQFYADFFPVDQTQASGFVAGRCAVSSLEEIGSPAALFGGENVWPRVTTTLLVKFIEVQVPTTAPASLAASGSVASVSH